MDDTNICLGEVRLLNRRAWNGRWRSRTDSVEAAKRVLELTAGCSSFNSDPEAGYAKRTLSWQAKWRGDFDTAMTYALDAEKLLPEKEYPIARGDLYSILGVLHYSRARLDLAAGAVERGLAILPRPTKKTDIPTRIDLLATLSTVQRYSGQLAHANVTLGTALDLATREDMARIEHNVARCVLADKNPALALEHSDRAVSFCETMNNRVVLPYAFEIKGECLSQLDQYADAEAAFSRGLEVALQDHDRRAQCQILHKHGLLEMKRGHSPKALDLFQHGATIAERMSYGLWTRNLEQGLAAAHEALGQMEAAVEAHKRAWAEAALWRS